MKKALGCGFAVFVFVGSIGLFAQTDPKLPVFGISFSGFLKTDLIYDSRQTVSLREGHFFLYPKGESLGKDGLDINAASSFQMLSVQTRLVGKITGPDALGAKTSGLIEGEFFGTSDGDTNGFRLRHGYIKLNWATAELMVGQFWHPMFVTECFPEVVSFNTGAPFQPFNRAPQVRFTQQFGSWSATATALAQRDFVSNGPDGASSVYARNAAVPEFNLKIQYFRKCEAGCETLFGIGGDYKRIVPRLSTSAGYRTSAGVDDWAGMAFMKYKNAAVTIKAEAVYGRNLHHLTMMGGYGVYELEDAAKAEVSYASVNNLSMWGEIQTNGTSFQAGLFFGYTKNNGAGKDLLGPLYARGADIDSIFRISPRLVYNAGKLRLAGEIEYTAAAYGKTDGQGLVQDAKGVGNLRLLGAVYYFF